MTDPVPQSDTHPEVEITRKYHLRIFETAHLSQDRCGIRNLKNFQSYWKACSTRLHSLRKHTKLTQGKGKFQKKVVKPELVRDSKYLEIEMVLAERAWAAGMQISKDNSDGDAKKTTHAVNRFKKAASHSFDLWNLCKVCSDKETIVESEAYHSWMDGELCIRQFQWQAALVSMLKTRAYLLAYSDIGNISQRNHVTQMLEDIAPRLMTCYRNLAHLANVPFSELNKAQATIDDYRKYLTQEERDEIDTFATQVEEVANERRTKEKDRVFEVKYGGYAVTVRTDALKRSFMNAQTSLEAANSLLRSQQSSEESKISLEDLIKSFDEVIQEFHRATLGLHKLYSRVHQPAQLEELDRIRNYIQLQTTRCNLMKYTLLSEAYTTQLLSKDPSVALPLLFPEVTKDLSKQKIKLTFNRQVKIKASDAPKSAKPAPKQQAGKKKGKGQPEPAKPIVEAVHVEYQTIHRDIRLMDAVRMYGLASQFSMRLKASEEKEKELSKPGTEKSKQKTAPAQTQLELLQALPLVQFESDVPLFHYLLGVYYRAMRLYILARMHLTHQAPPQLKEAKKADVPKATMYVRAVTLLSRCEELLAGITPQLKSVKTPIFSSTIASFADAVHSVILNSRAQQEYAQSSVLLNEAELGVLQAITSTTQKQNAQAQPADEGAKRRKKAAKGQRVSDLVETIPLDAVPLSVYPQLSTHHLNRLTPVSVPAGPTTLQTFSLTSGGDPELSVAPRPFPNVAPSKPIIFDLALTNTEFPDITKKKKKVLGIF
ncbi:putative Signal recognition particle subunit SRP68 [Blattamonas nauphoetae]|uniref:Signal recognition particle subunit SRP68 n=1 Tax=Blattamonas nauphoetae TaxID=2049346 RepID=A0ABQ9YC53_9EUKA|nr:putative Signal recognition particle subunit SRP68 [Blattamonas nauphoetae]